MTSSLDIALFPTRRLRPVLQSEIAECGLACLAMVASYHGLDVDLPTMRRRFGPSARGMTIRSLMQVADSMALLPRPVRVSLDGIDQLALPAVLHWNMNHFVVLERVVRGRALIHDPGGLSRWLSMSKVGASFTGVALELSPTANFEPVDLRQRIRLRDLWTRVRGLRRGAGQIILLSGVMQAFLLASPYYMQLAVDVALPGLDLGLLALLAVGFGLFAILNGAAAMLRSSVLLTLGTSFGFGLSTNVARRLFRLPTDWFSRRNVGDVLSRFQSVSPIRQMLAEDAPAALVDGALALITLALMSFYSLALAGVSACALLAYAVVRAGFFSAQRQAQEAMIVAAGREQSVMIESLRGIRSLRLSGREMLRHSLWQARLTDSLNGGIRFQRLANWQSTLHATIFALENVVSIWIAIALVMGGRFSVGMVLAFAAYKVQFLTAGASLLEKFTAFKMLGLHLERLADIALSPEDVSFREADGSGAALKGALRLRNVSYRYGAADPDVLCGVSLEIEAGESVAITGPSGGGKSTLMQIVLGLCEPTGGEVLVDDVPLASFGHQNYHRQVSAVLQDDTLFAGSLADNIAMFDDAPDAERIEAAARAAAIHDDIAAMAMRYDTLVGDMGDALSGGQRQRVILARALYRRPRVLVMDEATSHLDVEREREVNEAIAGMGITRIIVAHRQETIASADRVVRLEKGKLVDMSSVDEPITINRRAG